MALARGTKLGPYEIVALLGAGGMGEVYRARDSRLDRGVAIKLLPPRFAHDPDRVRRFEQEARAAGVLNDPHIVAIYDVGTHEGSPYLVSELLEGQTLRECLRAGAPPLRKALDYALQTAQGLTAAHQKGIVHRDLKPENLFITRNGTLKILDFGLAKLLEPAYDSSDEATERLPSAETEAGVAMGTAGYMSPEQVRRRGADTRSDIFSFGLILYEMLTGERAFRKASTVETMAAIVNEDPAPPVTGSMPRALEHLVRHCLEKDPEQRFQTARDLVFNLREIDGQAEPAQSSRITGKRRLWTIAGLTAIALILSFFAGEQASKRGGPRNAFPTFRPVTSREGTVTAARFAPDGQTIVYSAAWEGRPVELFSGRVEAPESRALGFPDSSLLAISSAGEMAITRGCEVNWGYCRGTLARVPMAGGAPRELLEQVDFAEWSRDGNALAVVRPVGGRYRLEYPIGKVLYETAGWISDPRISPRGDLIAFLDRPVLGSSSGAVAIVDLQGRKKTLSAGWVNTLGLAWRPKGEEIWFTGSRAGINMSLHGVTPDGAEREILRVPGEVYLLDISPRGDCLLNVVNSFGRIVSKAPEAAAERDVSWFDWSTTADLSKDGRTLLFYEWGVATKGKYVTYMRGTDGSEAVRLGEGKALALSPDGKWALTFQESQPRQLVLLPTGPGEPKVLPHGKIEAYYSVAWFPDGQRILFAGEGPDNVPRSYIQDVKGGEAKPILTDGMIAMLVSPEGKRVAAFNPEGEYSIYGVEGGRPTAIRGARPGDMLLQWNSDGRFMYARAPGDYVAHIFRIDLLSGRREQWKDLAPGDITGNIGIDAHPRGVRITPDGKAYAYTYWKLLDHLFLVEGLN